MASRSDCRPDPDELLRQIQVREKQQTRGRLKIFLGYAPRVGKSLRMFDEGKRRKSRGEDVVVGVVQGRGSEELQSLISQFEIVATRDDAVDVEAVLARSPQVCLMDEIAWDNPPGSRNHCRWQDVEEILSHGIQVICAINLQHIREQMDTVERITGRRASSWVPQSFIETADEIEIVDVPAGQLTELRETALLLAAQVVEKQLQHYMDEHGITQSWGTQERILVCITPQSPARAMLESGARAAQRFHGQLLAVTVKPRDMARPAGEVLEENLDYGQRLGAEVHVIESRGGDVVEEILEFAREQRITQIFAGHTRQSSWKFWKASPMDRLIAAAEGMDVRIFPPV